MRKRRPPSGAPPGALAARAGHAPARVHTYSYGPAGLREADVADLGELARLRDNRTALHWIDIQGLDDADTVRRIGDIFGIHPLVLADAVNTPQRPKAEVYGDQLQLVTHMVRHDAKGGMTVEQITLVVGPGFLITFQELDYGDVLDPVRARLRSSHNGLPHSDDVAYLAYAMLDTVIDGYYPVLEGVGEELERIEDEVVRAPTPQTLHRVQAAKRDLLTLRRHLWPLRDAVNSLVRGDAPQVSEAVRLHLRDCADHAVQLIDMLETYRELASTLMDAYLSSLSNRLNEIMKVLTVISTVFMPLSFLASLYGMNFEHMPELRSPWGYPVLLAFMIAIAMTMLVFFRRRGWLGDGTKRRAARRSKRA